MTDRERQDAIKDARFRMALAERKERATRATLEEAQQAHDRAVAVKRAAHADLDRLMQKGMEA